MMAQIIIKLIVRKKEFTIHDRKHKNSVEVKNEVNTECRRRYHSVSKEVDISNKSRKNHEERERETGNK